MNEFEQDFAYQSEPEATEEVSTEPIESNEPTEEVTPQTEAEDFDEIKYNKESIKVPASERQKLLQMGYHYQNKVQTEYEQLKQQNAYLDRLAQMSGYTNRDEFISAVNEAEQRQRIQQEAQRMGVDEESYKQYIAPVNQELQQLRSELHSVKYQETTRQIENEVNQLRGKYQDFDKYLDPVFDMAISRGYSLEDAYRLASYEDRMSNLSRQTEQEVLARVTGRDERQVIPSNDKPSNTKLDVASMSFDDIEALSARVRRGERITL